MKMKYVQTIFLLSFAVLLMTPYQSSAQENEAAIKAEKPREIFQVVESMPMFPGCSNEKDSNKRRKCSSEKMLEFIYGNLQYPKAAKDASIEGTVVTRMIVETDGSITNVEVVRDLEMGCGAEAKRVVESMPKWIPGTQRGRAVPVYFNLPIRFRL